MADTTTVHTAEVVRYDDPVIITERVAVAAFIAGYTDPTRRSYATDLRIFAGWWYRSVLHSYAAMLPSHGRLTQENPTSETTVPARAYTSIAARLRAGGC